ncbi:nucleoside monophosphate kinase [Candidatus Saccharibacteria bacterium]|nr:nucleoside monophosphate kinase [Candidatus Saccharibacteria bacterium]
MITLFGAPGAGKTEQGKLLAQKYGWEWVSYRDLLMELHDKDISYALEHGLFIDDDKATELMQNTLNRLKRSTPRFASDLIDGRTREIILDGFPADYRQVKWLIDNGEIKNLKGAIVLRVPRGELWRRLVARKRVDDTRAAIERRQDAYERNITGMIKTLAKNGVLVREVNGCNSPQDVLERIDDVLADWGMVPKKQYERISESSHKAPNWLQ